MKIKTSVFDIRVPFIGDRAIIDELQGINQNQK